MSLIALIYQLLKKSVTYGGDLMAEKYLTIKILGNDYRVVSGDDGDMVASIAGYVDSMIKRTKELNPTITNSGAAVLTSLNICEEMFKLKEEIEVYRERDEEYNALLGYKDKLVSALSELRENSAKRNALQRSNERIKGENTNLSEELAKSKSQIGKLESELEKLRQDAIEMQDKLLENQIELVRARKNILDMGEPSKAMAPKQTS